MDKKKILVSAFAILALVGTLGIVGTSHAAGITPPAVVTNAYWYGENSTLPVSPGSDYVPLFVQMEVNTSLSYVNASVNLSYYPGSPFSYSYISGPDIAQRTYYNFTPTTPVVTINQLVNVSSSASKGVYEVALEITSSANPSVPIQELFKVAVLGTPSISLVNYYTNPPALYQGQKYIQFTAVVSNTGAGPAKDMSVSLSSQDFSVITSPYNVAYMPSGMVQNFTFLMNAHNVTGDAPATLHMGNYSYQVPLYLNSHGSLAITDSIPALNPGSGSVLEQFNITNTGNRTMLGLDVHLLSPSVVSIHVPSSNPLAALTADNFTLAQLDPGQTVTVTYIVDVSSSAQAQTYAAQLYVQWNLNDTAQAFHQVYNFNEKVTPTALQQFTSSLTFTPLNIGVLVLIIVLVGLLVGVSARSRRMRKRLREASAKKEQQPSLIHRDLPDRGGEDKKN